MAPSMLVGDIRLKELEHGLIQGITTAKNTLSYKIPCRAHQVMSGRSYPAAEPQAAPVLCRPQAVNTPSDQQNIQTWKKPSLVLLLFHNTWAVPSPEDKPWLPSLTCLCRELHPG